MPWGHPNTSFFYENDLSTSFAKSFILDVFVRNLNMPLLFFYILAKLARSLKNYGGSFLEKTISLK